MSDNIPFELQIEIMERIPNLKSVIHCRSVSKAWKSVIDSKEFVAAHTLRHAHDQSQPHHLLIRKRDSDDFQVKYFSILDDDTFPHQNVTVFVPDSVNKFTDDSIIAGSCHGLFCVYEDKTSTAVIWNPLLRKTVTVTVPNVLRQPCYITFVGFGVCSVNLDPKLVKVTIVSHWSKLDDVNTSTHVEVFSLSSKSWRSPLSGSIPNKSIAFGYSQTVVDGFIYWSAIDRINVNRNLIMSFNLTTEEFTKVDLPKMLAVDRYADYWVYSLRESLAVVEFDDTKFDVCSVWMMSGHGCTRSFKWLYSIHASDVSLRATLGFRKSGAPVVELEDENCVDEFFNIEHELVTYEPESITFTDIGIHGFRGKFFVHSYKETLLLLGH